MGLWHFTKHAIGGGLLTAYAARKASKYVENNNISYEASPGYIGPVVGGVGGGVIGYYVAEKIKPNDERLKLKEKLATTAIGAATGALAGLLIADYLTKKNSKRK